MVRARLAALAFALGALVVAQAVVAGSISFRLSLSGAQLSLVNQGDSSAFYPAVYRLQGDGKWTRLAAHGEPADLAAGASMQLAWPEPASPASLSELERIQLSMVRFFDQSGVGFGQLSFFRAPPTTGIPLSARYENGALLIDPPTGASPIRASWLLWPLEEGIAPIRLPVRFVHRLPTALRIDWQQHGRHRFSTATGAGLPSAVLLHETANGLTLQQVPGGGLQGSEQRAAWLNGSTYLYRAALLALLLALGALVLQFRHRPRDGGKA